MKKLRKRKSIAHFDSKKRKFGSLPHTLIGMVLPAIIISLLTSSTGCIGPKRMDKWIGEKYGETTTSIKPKANYFSLTSPLITADEKTSSSTKNTRKFLPLIFYWEVDYQLSSTLNPKIPINLFISNFTTYANSKNLKEKLDGNNLELTINKIPTSFSLNDDFRSIVLLLIPISWEKIYLLPVNTDLQISYKLKKENVEVRNGILNIADLNQFQEKAYFKSMKKATIEYLTLYDQNIKIMAKSAVDQIIEKL